MCVKFDEDRTPPQLEQPYLACVHDYLIKHLKSITLLELPYPLCIVSTKVGLELTICGCAHVCPMLALCSTYLPSCQGKTSHMSCDLGVSWLTNAMAVTLGKHVSYMLETIPTRYWVDVYGWEIYSLSLTKA
jgi:hypothetical protein